MIVRSFLRYARGETPFSPWTALAPLGWVAGVLVKARNFSYDHGVLESRVSALPVVSVGNLTLGGDEQDPLRRNARPGGCS